MPYNYYNPTRGFAGYNNYGGSESSGGGVTAPDTSAQEANCSASGGTWDPVNNTCIPRNDRESTNPFGYNDRQTKALDLAWQSSPDKAALDAENAQRAKDGLPQINSDYGINRYHVTEDGRRDYNYSADGQYRGDVPDKYRTGDPNNPHDAHFDSDTGEWEEGDLALSQTFKDIGQGFVDARNHIKETLPLIQDEVVAGFKDLAGKLGLTNSTEVATEAENLKAAQVDHDGDQVSTKSGFDYVNKLSDQDDRNFSPAEKAYIVSLMKEYGPGVVSAIMGDGSLSNTDIINNGRAYKTEQRKAAAIAAQKAEAVQRDTDARATITQHGILSDAGQAAAANRATSWDGGQVHSNQNKPSEGSKALEASTRAQLASKKSGSGGALHGGGRNMGGKVGYNMGGNVRMDMNGMAQRQPMMQQPMMQPQMRNMGGMMHPNMMQQPMMRNMGGSIPMYANDGQMVNHPYDREGEHFDTVDAKLTPGEFVIDADSTHAIEQMYPDFLKDLNEWEPSQGEDAISNIISSAMEETTIKTKRSDGHEVTMKSPEGTETTADMMNQQMSAMGSPEVQLNSGGQLLSGLLSGLGSGNKNKRHYAQQRANAAKARNAERAGAGIAGGLGALGKGNDAQQSQLRGAGQRTTSTGSWGTGGYRGANFADNAAGSTNYSGQAQAIGQGAQETANAEAGYQNELNNIATSQFEADLAAKHRSEDRANQLLDAATSRDQELTDAATSRSQAVEDRDLKIKREEEKETKKLDEGKKDTLRLVGDASGLAKQAATAGDLINGFADVDQAEVDQYVDDNSWGAALNDIYESSKDYVNSAVRTGAEYAGLKDTAIRRYAAANHEASYRSYIRLETLSKNMLLPLVASGILGKTTDSDIQFAGQTLFDVEQPSNTWQTQLNDIKSRVNKVAIDQEVIAADIPGAGANNNAGNSASNNTGAVAPGATDNSSVLNDWASAAGNYLGGS